MSNPGWDRQTKPKDGVPHGWIRWKDTRVGMEAFCKCGRQFGIEGDFAYFVRCPSCATVYRVNAHVEFVELTAEEASTVRPKESYDDWVTLFKFGVE